MSLTLLNDAMQWDGYDRLARIDRWVSEKTINKESVAEHIFFVMLIAEGLFEACKPFIVNDIRYGLFTLQTVRSNMYASVLHHELDECVTTDVPFMVKKGPFKEHYAERSLELIEEHIVRPDIRFTAFGGFGDDKIIKPILNMADSLACVRFLEKELSMGNKSLEKVCIEVANHIIAMIDDNEIFHESADYIRRLLSGIGYV